MPHQCQTVSAQRREKQCHEQCHWRCCVLCSSSILRILLFHVADHACPPSCRRGQMSSNRIEALLTGALHFPNDRQHVGGETAALGPAWRRPHATAPAGTTVRRCRRTAPNPRLFHFCGMAGWETICERGSSLGFSQNTVFASPPNVRAFAWPRLLPSRHDPDCRKFLAAEHWNGRTPQQ